MTKIKKTETLEEFIKRGGKKTIIPAEKTPDETHLIKPNTTGLPKIISLDEGSHFFGETKKRKPKNMTNNEFIDGLKKLNLPGNMFNSIVNRVNKR